MEFKHSHFRLIMPVIFALLFSACSANQPTQLSIPQIQPISAPDVLSQLEEPVKFYQSQADIKNHPDQKNWQLLTARALIIDGKAQAALLTLNKIDGITLTAQQQFEFSLIKAEVLFIEKRYQDAEKVLSSKPALANSYEAHWQRYYLLKASIYEQLEKNVLAAESRFLLNQFLSNELQSNNNTKLWSTISALPLEALNQASFVYQNTQPILSGWFQLAAISIEYGFEPQLLISNLQAWKSNNPQHPALTDFPTELVTAMATTPYSPNHVAVMLPLTGKRGTPGRAIRDGILSAYYQEKQSERLNLRFYDTAKTDATTLYQRAIEEGADFVIGPLLKPNVEAIIPLVTDVPLISLNKLPENIVSDNIYYFSLTSNDEAIAAAKKMQKDGIKHPLVLAPQNAIGDRLASTFTQEWNELADEESQVYQYKNQADMQRTVSKLFSVDSSNLRISQMKALIGSDIKTKTRSRRDIDAIYIIATPQEAMLAIPYIITTQNPYIKQVAIYASSRTHSSNLPSNQSRDLNGLIFSDMPWLLNPDQELKSQTISLWPNMSKIEQNLFAMGYDTFKLIPNLLQLRNFPSLRIDGQTGILYVNDQGNIEREFSWGRYKSGKVILEKTNIESQPKS